MALVPPALLRLPAPPGLAAPTPAPARPQLLLLRHAMHSTRSAAGLPPFGGVLLPLLPRAPGLPPRGPATAATAAATAAAGQRLAAAVMAAAVAAATDRTWQSLHGLAGVEVCRHHVGAGRPVRILDSGRTYVLAASPAREGWARQVGMGGSRGVVGGTAGGQWGWGGALGCR